MRQRPTENSMVAGSMSVSKFLKIIIITEKAKHGIRFYPITVRKVGFLAYAGRKKKHVKVYFEIKYLLYFFRVSQEAKRGFTFFFFILQSRDGLNYYCAITLSAPRHVYHSKEI